MQSRRLSDGIVNRASQWRYSCTGGGRILQRNIPVQDWEPTGGAQCGPRVCQGGGGISNDQRLWSIVIVLELLCLRDCGRAASVFKFLCRLFWIWTSKEFRKWWPTGKKFRVLIERKWWNRRIIICFLYLQQRRNRWSSVLYWIRWLVGKCSWNRTTGAADSDQRQVNLGHLSLISNVWWRHYLLW